MLSVWCHKSVVFYIAYMATKNICRYLFTIVLCVYGGVRLFALGWRVEKNSLVGHYTSAIYSCRHSHNHCEWVLAKAQNRCCKALSGQLYHGIRHYSHLAHDELCTRKLVVFYGNQRNFAGSLRQQKAIHWRHYVRGVFANVRRRIF